MATLTPKTISELTASTVLGNDDLVPISSSSTSKKVTGRALLDSWYRQGTALVAGNDLDNFTTAGSYYSSLSSVSAAVLNSPVTTQGYRLDVVITSSFAYPTQIAVCYNGDIYRRSLVSTNDTPTWKPWVKMLSDGDVVAIEGGGTNATTASAALSNLGGVSLVKITDANFTGTTAADLVAALNRASFPTPPVSFILQIGSTSPICKATLMVSLLNTQSGGAIAASFYASINGTKYRLNEGTWTVAT